jgi:hypothetical protein
MEMRSAIVGLETPYRRVVRLFGTPLERRPTAGGECAYYRLVGEPGRGWEFCFKHGRMYSAGVIDRRDFSAGKRKR